MNAEKTNNRINKIETTTDTITGRGGLALFNRYIDQIGIKVLLDEKFGDIRKSAKGLSVWMLFKQIFCFLFDGTSRHLVHFDHLKKDEGYAAAIEVDTSDMASSHMVKRFFGTFHSFLGRSFRWILHKLFVWRLQIECPDEIEMYLDTMVMNNDDAEKRHGVQVTYKKVKGFQPLQIIWNGKIVDAIFRGGKKHSNCGNSVVNMVGDLVKLIRKEYREDITIILRCDAGFFDEKNFEAFDKMNIGFIASGKMYEGVKQLASSVDQEFWGTYDNGRKEWKFVEFGFKCESWNFFLRAVYTHLVNDGPQMLFEFARPDNVILTNIGINEKVLQYCSQERREYWLKIDSWITSHHQNGTDELAHRGFKNFGFEQLPFKKFACNNAFYYCMLIAFFLFETFKEDTLFDILPITSYATTVRRKIVDIAAKISRTGRKIILKISNAVMEDYKIDSIWQRCQNPPPIFV